MVRQIKWVNLSERHRVKTNLLLGRLTKLGILIYSNNSYEKGAYYPANKVMVHEF